ncbi:MAG: hypothetical protein OXI88_16140, partial [Gammaproteobacteria bacterium]|nr:hypothetical protein [Gammaproteobacteria bacterium]
NKSILDLSEHATQKCDFCVAHIINDVSSLIMAIHPCIAGTSDLIRGSLVWEALNQSEYSKNLLTLTESSILQLGLNFVNYGSGAPAA